LSQAWRQTIARYFDDLLTGDLPVDAFCSGYEKWWSLDLPDRNLLTQGEFEVLELVFDTVVVYSPFKEELRRIPMYKSEREVREIVEEALRELNRAST
jgi:hypothetical protein